MRIFIYTKGFTLVETLVAITILIMVIVGPMTIAQKGVQSAYFANDQVTAVFLAQEAIEGVRVLRDELALDANSTGSTVTDTASWLSGLSCTGGCKYDTQYPSNPFIQCTGGNCASLYVNNVTGAYSHNSGDSPTPFTRVITIGALNNGGVPVDVLVSWNNHGAQKEVKLQTWIYNHYERYEN